VRLDPDSLLAGPRGRRFCLELVKQAEPITEAGLRLGHLLFAASYRAAKASGAGTSIVLFGPGADEPLPDPTPAELGAALDEVELPHLDDDTLMAALEATVDAAAYWQEPDGDDLLLVEPAVTASLRRIAEHVVSTPATAWWGDGLAARQHLVAFDTPWAESREPPSWSIIGTRAALRQWRDGVVADEIRSRPRRGRRSGHPARATSGEWWSTPNRVGPVSTHAGPDGVPLGLRLVEDGFGEDGARVVPLVVPPDARVIEVAGPDDWARLCREHPLEVSGVHRGDWYRTTGRDGDWVSPDWASVAEVVDAVHVSVAGYLLTAGRAIAVDDRTASVMAGWSPDQTYWLTEMPGSDAAPTAWAKDDDTLRWTPSPA